ncbi:phosphoheptose isomerase [Geobacter sp. OR-1]|uniref:D-sedoheptulose 7-phosphate isomerase n=1 Tax=Geobacter sp. OR-1 TaxID=1266765 RepID=UPI000543D87C|nr:D-sedoheptulose 7-phosphate isomerase [Geobacter sp. OR-1]GAM08174.1 phosphoheptose isomerase [Geobacter sp. OR-1]
MKSEITRQLEENRRVISGIASSLANEIERFVELLSEALDGGNKLIIMGNGGSAADAQHFAAEIVGRFKMERRALPAIALTTDSSILTAIGNDYGFDRVFARQVEAFARPGDVVVGISTSGSSENVVIALEAAKGFGCRTVGLLGRDGGSIAAMVDLGLVVPSDNTPRIQEGHITIIHIVCDLLEKRLFT